MSMSCFAGKASRQRCHAVIERIAGLPNVTIHPHTELRQLEADTVELALILLNTPLEGGAARLDVRRLFLFMGASPDTEWLSTCGVVLESTGSFSAAHRSAQKPGVRPWTRPMSI